MRAVTPRKWFRRGMLLPSSLCILNVEEISFSNKAMPTSKAAHCCSLTDHNLNTHQCENLQMFCSQLSDVFSSLRTFSSAVRSHVSSVCIFHANKNLLVNGCTFFLSVAIIVGWFTSSAVENRNK